MNWNQNKQYGNYPGVSTTPNYNQPFGANYGAPAQQQQTYYYNPPQYQMPAQRPLMNGRIIRSLDEIVPDDVKMDGSCSFFPVQDGSAIFAMRWSQDGSRIEQVRYVPEQSADIPESKSFEQQIMERLDALEEMIKNQSRYHGKKQFKNKEENLNERTDTENSNTNGSKQP